MNEPHSTMTTGVRQSGLSLSLTWRVSKRSLQLMGGRDCSTWGAHEARWAAFCSARSTVGHTGRSPVSPPSLTGRPRLWSGKESKIRFNTSQNRINKLSTQRQVLQSSTTLLSISVLKFRKMTCLSDVQSDKEAVFLSQGLGGVVPREWMKQPSLIR